MLTILVSCPIKADATSYYRGWGPLRRLTKSHDVRLIDAHDKELSWDLVMQADLVFLQRPSTDLEIRLMEVAKHCNVPTIIDYDDDYLHIPQTNPRHELYADPHRVEQIKRAVKMATQVWTSTVSIKENLVLNTGTDRKKFHVIPNAVDDEMFSLMVSGADLKDRDVILWRGGDTHVADIEPYIDAMAQAYNNYPQFKWAFMGAAPQSFLAQIDCERIMLFEWRDVMEYFHMILELKPRVTIVPWEFNPFNNGKSNCSWLESTIAGAATIFPAWSTEFVDGMIGYQTADDFYNCLKTVLTSDLASTKALDSMNDLRKFKLSKINEVRFDNLKTAAYSKKKLDSSHPLLSEPLQKYTDEEFFNYTHEHRWNQDYEQYRKGMHGVCEWLHNEFQPSKILELGCGPGAMMEWFLDNRVPQVIGIELNPYFKNYFSKRNPHYKDYMIVGSFLDMEIDGVMDLGISIEVFEHIEHDKLMPFIERMAKHFKYFYFSSTPYKSTKKFDHDWGHCNIKTHEAWKALFEKNGFEYVSNPQKVIKWDMLFKSTLV
jgi:2-polyprenyl-3-methyl-5-hydroxy-6-metoxy-1,4-benzoquinol methylase